ncbi:12020_t:CDS:2 [Dentiscutata erythropus]|uniref:12020_t:CDS:1 n=1 Tax=Dentiscutata erythropus TaxID=1348616 RepID=A0A9N8YUU7_9GLOM|nr:12020_t:CDS:2 [Dentiscutata erythropus]
MNRNSSLLTDLEGNSQVKDVTLDSRQIAKTDLKDKEALRNEYFASLFTLNKERNPAYYLKTYTYMMINTLRVGIFEAFKSFEIYSNPLFLEH